MPKSNVKGLKEFQRNIKKLRKKVEKVGGQRALPIEEILTDTFVQKFTNYASLAELLEKSGFSFETQEDFNNIPQEDFDQFIRDNTLFSSWQDMINVAGQQWMKDRLNLS